MIDPVALPDGMPVFKTSNRNWRCGSPAQKYSIAACAAELPTDKIGSGRENPTAGAGVFPIAEAF
jgi:hypothetical protein